MRKRLIRSFQSESNPKVKHFAQLVIDNGEPVILSCTCRGFTSHGHCWHLEQCAIDIKAQGTVLPDREVKRVDVEDMFA